MKRTVMLVLECILALGLFSCGSDDNDDDERIAILVNDAETVSAAETGDLLILRLSNGVPADWSVSDTSVATLSAASGVSVCLIAQAAGNVTVTATAGGMRYTRALQITAKDGTPNGGETNAPNVIFTNLSAYKVIVCRDGLGAEVATVAAGDTKSVYVSPGANEITFHFRYAYCIIADDDSGTVWLDVADNGAYTYPVDSADIAQGAVQINIPAPKNPQFNAAYLKVENQSAQPISLYNGNTQQKLYGQEKYYIQPGHSGVYSIPPDAPFDGFSLGENTASATAIAPFYAVSGTLYQCAFSEDNSAITTTEENWLREPFTVTFETNGGSAIPSLTASLLETTLIPATTLEGYYFAGWYADPELQRAVPFPRIMTADITLYAKWLENANTPYTVHHFLQNTDRSTYTLQDTEPLTGTTAAATIAAAKTYKGFTAKAFTQETISADGSTIVTIYYDRNAYTVTFDANDGTGATAKQTFYYGVTQKLKHNTFTNPDYTFIGWAVSATDNPVYNNQAELLIDGNTPSGITLYAAWFYTVTAANVDTMDLANRETDTYTVKVKGDITQHTLAVLADKINSSMARSIDLDMTEATGLATITADDNATSLFAGCPLNSVALPAMLETIGDNAFAGCSITSVSIPASVRTIGEYAFSNCSKLESVEIDEVETVGNYAFESCKSLKTVVLKNTKTIGSSAFYGCKNISSVTIKSVNSIKSEMFYNCSSLELLEIDGAEIVGYKAFYNCNSLKTITLKNIDTIDNNAFRDCINLSSVTMETIGTIDRCAFQGCTSLSSITIDAESIGYSAFSSCTSLTAVVIGKNVKSIDNTNDGCFKDCSQLTSIRFEDTKGWYYKFSSNGSSYTYTPNVTIDTYNASNIKYYDLYLWYKE